MRRTVRSPRSCSRRRHASILGPSGSCCYDEGIDRGQRGRREPELSLVDTIERRRSAGRDQRQEQNPGHQPERRRPRRRRRLRLLPGSPGYRPAVSSCSVACPVAAGLRGGDGHLMPPPRSPVSRVSSLCRCQPGRSWHSRSRSACPIASVELPGPAICSLPGYWSARRRRREWPSAGARAMTRAPRTGATRAAPRAHPRHDIRLAGLDQLYEDQRPGHMVRLS